MKRKGSTKLSKTWITVIFLLLLVTGLGAMILEFPALFGTLGIDISNDVYHATGGVIGKPAPAPPPVIVKVGEQLLNRTNGIVITWNGNEPIGSGPETYFGDDQGMITVYALNVTNNENVPIIREIIYYTGGPVAGTNYPPIKPWYTNSSYNVPGRGLVTNWLIANVTIMPHTSMILYNTTFLSTGDYVYFYFENGTVYRATITYVPSVPL